MFKARHWPVLEIGIFKWTCILFGMIIGAYLADFVKTYVWVLAPIAALGTFRVLTFYFGKVETKK